MLAHVPGQHRGADGQESIPGHIQPQLNAVAGLEGGLGDLWRDLLGAAAKAGLEQASSPSWARNISVTATPAARLATRPMSRVAVRRCCRSSSHSPALPIASSRPNEQTSTSVGRSGSATAWVSA